MTSLLSFLEESWLFVFFISIVFIFFMVFRELRVQTRRTKRWKRSSYSKTIPRIRLTFHHFSRKGDLLTTTSYNICRSIHKDLLAYMQIARGYTPKELDEVINSPELLAQEIPDSDVRVFLTNTEKWLKSIQIEESFSDRVKDFFQRVINPGDVQESQEESIFYLQLASIIKKFQQQIESGS
jgi:hypothetical protein